MTAHQHQVEYDPRRIATRAAGKAESKQLLVIDDLIVGLQPSTEPALAGWLAPSRFAAIDSRAPGKAPARVAAAARAAGVPW